uniref:Extracellular globin n=1 Tax=Macrobdella decora TaxID=6405 RepID=Q760P9_MACDE|nr:hemoglobin, chain C [Macrobdella decora]
MLKLSVIFGFVLIGTIYATDEECSSADGHKVLEDWTHLWEDSDASFKVEFAKSVLLKLIEKHPEAKALFHEVGVEDPSSGEFEAHVLRIFNSLDLLITLLPNREGLKAASEHLGQQHAVRHGVVGTHFKTFLSVLLDSLDHLLDDFHLFAWKSCLKTLTKGIVDAVPQ